MNTETRALIQTVEWSDEYDTHFYNALVTDAGPGRQHLVESGATIGWADESEDVYLDDTYRPEKHETGTAKETNLDGFIEALESFMMDADPVLVRDLNRAWTAHQERIARTLDANNSREFFLRVIETLRQTDEENERVKEGI